MPKKRSHVEPMQQFSGYAQDNSNDNQSASDVIIELQPRNNVPTDQLQPQQFHTIPRSAIHDELPSRDRAISDLSRIGSNPPAYATIRANKIPPSVFIKLAEDEVVQRLQNNPDIREKPKEEQEKIQNDNLREYHYHLTSKRKVRKQLRDGVGVSSKPKKNLGCLKQTKYSISMKWQHMKNGLKEILSGLELWQKPLHIIEGNFGSSVASYFYFFRRLFRLNCLTFLILFLFVVIPHLLLNHVPGAHDKTSNLTCLEGSNKTFFSNYTRAEFLPEMILTGGGWFEHTAMYYGNYSSRIISLTDNLYYNMPLAYLLCIGSNMIVVLIFMAYALAKSYKQQYIEHSGLPTNFFFNKSFCGWDFAITNTTAANNHKSSVRQDLLEQLAQETKNTRKSDCMEKMMSALMFVVFNAVALLLLAGAGWLVYFLLESHNLETDIKLLGEMSISLLVTCVTLIVPAILTFMIDYEGYKSQNTKLCITMTRLLLLVLVMLSILLIFWTQSGEIKQKSWETEVGKEMYRLVLMDLIVCDVLYFFAFWLKSIILRSTVFKNMPKFKNVQITNGWKWSLEFDVAWQTWNLLYNQMLCWIGSFFCPLLPVIVIIKMIFRFYIKQCSVRCHSKPPERAWRAQRAQTIFLVIAFAAVISSVIGLGVVIVQVKPSKLFGPFKTMDSPYEIILCVTSSFTDRQWLGKIADFIVQPGCVSLFVIFLCCFAYCSKAMAAAKLKMMKLLREQVTLEGKDKAFLLRKFDTVLRSYQNATANAVPPSSPAIVEAKNYVINENPATKFADRDNYSPSTPMSNSGAGENWDRRSSVDSEGNSRRDYFARKLTTPTEHRIIAENSPLSSNRRRRQSSVPRDSESDASNIELNPYRSQDNLTTFPFTNPAFREDSPYKSKSPTVVSPYHGGPLPGVSHQPPFQNLGRGGNGANKLKGGEENLKQKKR